MISTRLQDAKSVYKDHVCLYTLAMSNLKIKRKLQFHL